MPSALADAVKVALELPVHQQLALASFLWESAEGACDPAAEAAWDEEIRERIRAIDEGRVIGVPYEEVKRQIAERLRT